MDYKVKSLDDGVGFVSHTGDNLPMLSTFKSMEGTGLSPKIGLSLCSGCAVKCAYCFTNGYQQFRVLTTQEIMGQANMVFDYCNDRKWLDHLGEFVIEEGFLCPQSEIKISFKQMGDPLLNPTNTIATMVELQSAYPKTVIGSGSTHPYVTFVVSTSGPKFKSNGQFFKRLNDFHSQVRLQFSCHTTSETEIAVFCNKIEMMTLEEIAKIANKSRHSVTLNFVMFKGYKYSARKIKNLFDRHNVFIKINYIDKNKYTKAEGFEDMSLDKVKRFTDKLSRYGFNWQFRSEHTKGKRLEIVE